MKLISQNEKELLKQKILDLMSEGKYQEAEQYYNEHPYIHISQYTELARRSQTQIETLRKEKLLTVFFDS